MDTQLEMALGTPPPPTKPTLAWWQEESAHAVRHCGCVPFEPRKAKAIVLATLNHSTWTTFCDLCDATNMATRVMSYFLERMVARRRIIAAPLYFGTGLLDRTIRPAPAKYLGFEYGYRLPEGR